MRLAKWLRGRGERNHREGTILGNDPQMIPTGKREAGRPGGRGWGRGEIKISLTLRKHVFSGGLISLLFGSAHTSFGSGSFQALEKVLDV